MDAIKKIETVIEKIKKDCFEAGTFVEGNAEKILVNTLHELATATSAILDLHKAKEKEAKAKPARQVLLEEPKAEPKATLKTLKEATENPEKN